MATAIDRQGNFEKDVRAYLELLPDLLKDSEGKYVLIGAADFAGVFDALESAMQKGYERFGQRGFIVRPISKQDLEMRSQWLARCLH